MRRSVVEIGEVRKVEVRGLKALYHKTGNPVKEARFLRDVLDRGMSQHDVARELGISQGHISRRLALLERLTPALLRRVEDGEITPGTAYVLSRLSKSAQKAFEDREKVTLKAAEEAVRENVVDARVLALTEDAPGDPEVEVCPTCKRPL